MSSSKRLTKEIRRTIVESVILKTFKDREEERSKKSSALFSDIINFLIPPVFNKVARGESDYIKKSWFPTLDCLNVRKDGYIIARLKGNSMIVPFDFYMSYSGTSIKYQDIPIGTQIELDEYIKYSQRIIEDKKTVRKTAESIVNSVKTFDALREIWCDVDQYYKFPEEVKHHPIVPINYQEFSTMIEKFKETV